ncbi:hypothetical protein FRAHR75_200065 [Frankia sp. Hr75.2]|nr:hypothetical protein FRAHR75_200065 [Frankia sp. Hr75.2]
MESSTGSGLGRQRWPEGRTFPWLHQSRQLRTQWERRVDIHRAFLGPACPIICLRKLQASFGTGLRPCLRARTASFTTTSWIRHDSTDDRWRLPRVWYRCRVKPVPARITH